MDAQVKDLDSLWVVWKVGAKLSPIVPNERKRVKGFN